ERALHTSARGDGGLRRAAQVRVVEVHETVRRRARLPGTAELIPRGTGLLRAHRAEHLADGLAVADHDLVLAADLAALGLDPDPARRTHQRHRDLARGADDLERGGAARGRDAAPREEGAAPDGR